MARRARRSARSRGCIVGLPLYRCSATAISPRSPSGSRTSRDRKSTRLNSSHSQISYAVFCLKKKKKYDLINNTIHQTEQLAYWTIDARTIYVEQLNDQHANHRSTTLHRCHHSRILYSTSSRY